MADAEAIAKAASRRTMRFIEVKTPEPQGPGMILRLRDILVGQRTQTLNALRGHLAEFGVVTAKGRENVDKLRSALDREEETVDNPASTLHMAQHFFDQIDGLSKRIADLDVQVAAAGRHARLSARLQKMPGVGPITSMALGFRSNYGNGQSGARRLGLVGPCATAVFEHWRTEAGRTGKSGQRYIQRFLNNGAMTVMSRAKVRRPATNSRLGLTFAHKPTMLATIALANKMARILWAPITKDEEFRGKPLSAI